MLIGYSKRERGRRRQATLQLPEFTIASHSILLAQCASLAVIFLAGAAAAAEGQPPAPRPSLAACQAKDKTGLPKQACVEAQESEVFANRRQRLNADAQRECRVLESAISESEQVERRARAAMMESIQQDLFILRQRYRKQGC